MKRQHCRLHLLFIVVYSWKIYVEKIVIQSQPARTFQYNAFIALLFHTYYVVVDDFDSWLEFQLVTISHTQ